MQHDEHVWAWRTYRFHLRGLYAGMAEIGMWPQQRLGTEFERVRFDNLPDLYAR